MKQLVMLACAAVLTIARANFGQDQPDKAPPPLAGAVIHGQAGDADPRRLRDALEGLDAFVSFDDGASVAAILHVLLEAASAPGTNMALLGIEDGSPTVALVTPGSVEMDSRGEAPVHGWNGDGVAYLLYHRGDDRPDPAFVARSLDGLATAFESHRNGAKSGVELMLDLENLRRAWPESLADGPARRIVAATGLANARKVHVHIPEAGGVRLSYSSRAEPADKVAARQGPQPASADAVGVRWPAVFDTGLRAYAIALDEEARQAFGKRFQTWMDVNGNRLRGILQAVEVGMHWSITPLGDGPRAEVTVPVRQGIQIDRFIEAVNDTAANSGFEVLGRRAVLTLPETVATALGGKALAVEVDGSGDAALLKITIE